MKSNNTILQEIQKQGISPKPKWHFVFKEVLIWSGTILSLCLASLSFGSLVFQSVNRALLPPQFRAWSLMIQIILILLFLVTATIHISHTQKGYKRTYKSYLIVILVLIGIIGGLLFSSRLSGSIEKHIRLGSVEQINMEWSKPQENGLLAGELIEVNDEGLGVIKALDGSEHTTDFLNIPEQKQGIFLDALRTKMVGYYTDDIFYPCAVMPWELKRAPPERRDDYGPLQNGNKTFRSIEREKDIFKKYFERKSEVVRTNRCD